MRTRCTGQKIVGHCAALFLFVWPIRSESGAEGKRGKAFWSAQMLR
ncbi:hypothetical protein AIOL_002594 [Candidatus Rhodobacter oscarellae]|uniref:Uncharacterized protein n=1 Tax=Candidatus Rhodobacter oscarellae TaxID=1675527 RepID=A0A0J9E777_9RHOB|nr:hypothetical protein AIOL_002594 [Candidatus Rhodobacter lobularis]